MKKILLICGVAIATFGIYGGAFGESNTFVNESYSTIESANFQDTIPGRKRDTTNRRPMPKDTVRRDSSTVLLQPMFAR